jgi:inner membrane protein
MASLFGHALSGIALGKISLRKSTVKIILLCVLCTVIPDADVIGFRFGIEYESPFGHRGFTHSILFAVVFSFIITFSFFWKEKFSGKQKIGFLILFFVCTLSHGMLDAMTTGGLGVGFFVPFNNERFFFPWRPIRVSPLGVSNFFSEWGWRVIKSEMIWIGIPSLILIAVRMVLNSNRKNNL